MFTEILKNPADPAGSGKNPAGYRIPDNSKNPAGYPAGPDIRCIPNRVWQVTTSHIGVTPFG